MYVAGDIAALPPWRCPASGSSPRSAACIERAGSLATIDSRAIGRGPATGGTAILNADDPSVSHGGSDQARVLTYGFAPDADVSATDTRSLGTEACASSAERRPAGGGAPARALGIHNALAAAAVGVAGFEARLMPMPWPAAGAAPTRSSMPAHGAS